LNRFEQSRRAVLYLFFLVFVVRFILLLISDDSAGDAIARIYIAKNMIGHQLWITDGGWFPLHFYLIAGVLLLYDDPLFAPRLISFLCGTAIVFPFYYLVKNVFNARNALTSIIFLTFYNLHVYFSLVSYAESLTLFLIISTLYYFFKYIYSTDYRLQTLMAASVMLMMACMVRAEPWPLIGLLSLILCWYGFRRNPIKTVISAGLFVSLPLIYIILWCFNNYMAFGDPFYSFTWGTKIGDARLIPPFYASWEAAQQVIQSGLKWITILFWTLGPMLALFILIGLGRSVLERRHIPYLVIPVSLWALTFTQTIMGNLTIQPRYGIYSAVLLIPFGAFALIDITGKVRKTLQPYIGIGCILLTLGITAGGYYIGRSMPPTDSVFFAGLWNVRFRSIIPDDMKQLGAWLKSHYRSNEKVLVDIGPYAGNITMAAGLDDLTHVNGTTIDYWPNLDRLYRASPVLSYKPDEFLSIDAARDHLKSYIETYKPRYVLYYTRSAFSRIFQFPGVCATHTWHGFPFQCRYERGGYHIYEILYE